MYRAYKNEVFFNMKRFPPKEEIYKNSFTIIGLDDLTRGPDFGYTGSYQLYRDVSCSLFLSYIDVPFLVLQAKDDVICLNHDIPKMDLMDNPNAIFLESEYGNHCDFFTQSVVDGKVQYRRFFKELLVRYLRDFAEFEQRKK